MITPWGCHRPGPRAHPWLPIADIACGYDDRQFDPRCTGCHRTRPETPQDQLDALHALGEAAQAQCRAERKAVPPETPAAASA